MKLKNVTHSETSVKNDSFTKVCTFGQPECTDWFGLMSYHECSLSISDVSRLRRGGATYLLRGETVSMPGPTLRGATVSTPGPTLREEAAVNLLRGAPHTREVSGGEALPRVP